MAEGIIYALICGFLCFSAFMLFGICFTVEKISNQLANLYEHLAKDKGT